MRLLSDELAVAVQKDVPTRGVIRNQAASSGGSEEVDGTQMEVLTVRDSAGVIRTAYNTCQICYDSGRGYYVQSGSVLVCQNCGNRFTADQVEVQSGGCNPWPIFPQSKTVTDEAVCISYDELHRATEIFAGWKQ